MNIFKKKSNKEHSEKKRQREKQLEDYNTRQEEYDDIYKNEKQKRTFKSLLDRLKLETYTKRLVAIVVFIGLLDLQLSYVLAFLGREQIAESLSSQICVTLLGTILVYVIRAYFDTRAEKRDELLKSGIDPNKIGENDMKNIIKDSGLKDHIESKFKTRSCFMYLKLAYRNTIVF